MISLDQVTALAPDAASLEAGKGLAVASKWTDLGHNGQMFWGLAKGSGSKPYRTQVACSDFSSKCSCPSRKFPCKHALGLMFIAADDLSKLSTDTMPGWVQEWLESRTQRKEKAEQKRQSAKPKDQEAAARTRKKREARVDEGVDFLHDFLFDLLTQGLGQVNLANSTIWDGVARRLIDCQAPGLANHVRRLDEIAHVKEDTEQRLLHEMGSLYLLLNSYRQRNGLSENMRAEIEQRIGWQIAKEDVLKGRCISDDWFVAYRTIEPIDKLTAFSSWLYGQKHQQWALLLSFGTSSTSPVGLWPVGSVVSTELAFYPGVSLERAIPVNDSASVVMDASLEGLGETIEQFLQGVSTSSAENPWKTRFPCLINAQPVLHEGRWMLLDVNAQALPWQSTPDEQLMIRSVCGGQSTLLAGEWDGRSIRVYAVDDQGAWFVIRGQFQ